MNIKVLPLQQEMLPCFEYYVRGTLECQNNP